MDLFGETSDQLTGGIGVFELNSTVVYPYSHGRDMVQDEHYNIQNSGKLSRVDEVE